MAAKTYWSLWIRGLRILLMKRSVVVGLVVIALVASLPLDVDGTVSRALRAAGFLLGHT
jgi:hypothetical protein